MIRNLFIVIFCFMIFVVGKADNYEVFKLNGNVIYADSQKEVYRHEILSLNTKIIIGENGSIGVLDTNSNRIYFGKDEGLTSVSEIINKAKKKSESTIKTINSQIACSANADPTYPMELRKGVSAKGEDEDEDEVTVEAYKGINEMMKYNEVTNISEDLVLSALFLDPNIFCFSVTNLTEEILYANILCVSSEGDISICLNIGYEENEPYLRLNPGVCAMLEDFAFVRSENQKQYILFATKEPFDSQLLQQMIYEKREIPDSITPMNILTNTISL